MKNSNLIDVRTLLEQARNSEHKESYRVLDRRPDYRIGVGVRMPSPDQQFFFLEVLIYLCPDATQVDIPLLEKKLVLLKKLKERGYSLTCQDDNCVTCEIIVPSQNLSAEYKIVESTVTGIFQEEE